MKKQQSSIVGDYLEKKYYRKCKLGDYDNGTRRFEKKLALLKKLISSMKNDLLLTPYLAKHLKNDIEEILSINNIS